MTKSNDYNWPLYIAMCKVGIRFAYNTTQTLIDGELKTTPALINVAAG